VILWLGAHGTALEAGFVLAAWLDAGGEKELVKGTVILWLGAHGTALEAEFVLKAWLDAGGEKDLVRDGVGLWLACFSEVPETDYLIRAWLQRKGEFALVRGPAILWMRLYKNDQEAAFLTKFLAKQVDLPTETVHDILAWCRNFFSSEDALWRLTSLGRHFHRAELTSDFLITFEGIARSAFTQQEIQATKRALMWQVFSLFSRWRELRVPTQILFLTWLRHPDSFSPMPSDLISRGQSPELLLYIAELISSKALSVKSDRPHLARFFVWLATWKPEHQDEVRAFLVKRAGEPEPPNADPMAAPGSAGETLKV